MTAQELIEKIRAEVERLKEANAKLGHTNDIERYEESAYGNACDTILSRLSDLEKEEKPMNPEAAMKELDEKIALVKQRRTWDGADVDKYMDEVRGREPEKPTTSDGLEEEIERYLHSLGVGYGGWVDGMEDDDLRGIARHFYELGCRRISEKYDEIEYKRQRAEESEKPSEGLEEDVKSWFFNEISSKINVEHTMYYYFQECARRYYELGKQSKPKVSEELEEEYKDYVESDPVYSKLVNRNAGLSIARHFAKWQKEQDEKELSEKIASAYQLGLADKEKQMMKIITKDDNLEEAGTQYVETYFRDDVDWTPDVIKSCLEEAFISGGEYVFKQIKYE